MMRKAHTLPLRALALLLAVTMILGLLVGAAGPAAFAAADEPGPNLALGKTADASGTADGSSPSYAVDGDAGTVWISRGRTLMGRENQADPSWFSVDLGDTMTVSRVILRCGASNYGYTYRIQVSNEENPGEFSRSWTTVYSTYEGDGNTDDIVFTATDARHVRFYGTARSGSTFNLNEFEVYAPRDMAAEAEVSASSGSAGGLTDGDPDTAWTSAGDADEWFQVDLGGPVQVGSVAIDWGADYASSYAIQVSEDGSVWSEAYRTQYGQGGSETVNLAPPAPIHYADQDNGTQSTSIPVLTARYVRVALQDGPGGAFSASRFAVYANGWTVTPETGGTILPEIDMNDGWKLARVPDVQDVPAAVSSPDYTPDGDSWIDATVPGTVLTSYYDNGLIPDPYYSDNMDKLDQMYFNVDYWYRKDIELSEDYAGQRIFLNFEGVNWFSDVYINGQRVKDLQGAFKRDELDVSQYMVPGAVNTVAVNVHIYPTKAEGSSPDPSEWANSDETRWTPNFICSQSWDWMPAIPGRNIGIIKDVTLSTANGVTVGAPFVTTELPLPDTDSADITVQADLVNSGAQPVAGTLKGVIQPGGIAFEQAVVVPGGSTVTVELDPGTHPQLHIQDPELWWPNGYGEQNLYSMELSFETEGVVSDTTAFNFGVRQYTYENTDYYDPDTPNLIISCNGVRILCKGGNWGMTDAMLGWGPEDYDTALRLHAEENFNMIRTWHGTSDFEAFYDACDKYGMMVFEDFQLNGWWTPVTIGPFIDNMYNKMERLRNRACVVLWCGENEATPPWPLEYIMPNVAEEMDPSRLFILRSDEQKENNQAVAGVVVGGVTYTAQDPAWYYRQAEASKGFTTEIGTPVIPNYESVMEMMEEEYWWPIRQDEQLWRYKINYMWQYHDLGGQSDNGNKGAENYLNAIDYRYGESASLEEFALKAQMVNLETNRAMFEAWNNYLFENSSGILLWMSQSAWPSTMWQTYDYYFDTNGAFFGCKIGSEVIHVQYDYDKHDVKVINNTPDELADLTVLTEIYNLDGTLFTSSERTLDAAGSTATQAENIQAMISADGLSDVHFIRLTLTDDEGEILSSNFYWRNKNGTTNYQALETLDEVKLDMTQTETTRDGVTTVTATLENSSDTVAVMTRLKLMQGAQRVAPVYYDDNYFAMLPGETKVVTIEYAEEDLDGDLPAPTLVMEGFNTYSTETSALTAREAAETVTSLENPKNGDQLLRLPTVKGFDVAIKSSSHPSVIGLDRSVNQPYRETEVTLVLTLTNKADRTDTADTAPITVTVPKKVLLVALNKPVWASSVGDGQPAENAVDGNMSSRWGCNMGTQQVQFVVDLQGTYTLDEINIWFESAFPIDFTIEYTMDEIGVLNASSVNGVSWTVLERVTDNDSTEVSYAFPQPPEAKYVRLYATRVTQPGGIHWGMSIYELEIISFPQPTAAEIAAGITALEDPGPGDTRITLPVEEGFDIAIKRSSNEGVIALDGTITPPPEDTEVELVLAVTSSGNPADTAEAGPFAVTVPGAGGAAVESVRITGSTAVRRNQTTQLTAVVTPDIATTAGLTWTSLNPAIATIDQNGVVTGKQQGFCFIQVNAPGGVTAAFLIEVTP